MYIPIGYGQVTWRFSGPGVPLGAACTLGFQNSGAHNATVAAANAMAAWETEVLPVQSAALGLNSVLVKLGPNDTGPTAVATSGDPGGDASEQAPPQCAYLVHKLTNLGGRKGRGRMYVPGVDETEIAVGGTIQALKLAELETAFNDLKAFLEGVDMEPVLLHSGPGDPAPTTITDFSVSATIATQRRRLRR